MNKTMAHRSDPHLARRLWHFGGVMTMFFVDWFCSPEVTLKASVTVTGLLVTLDLLRLRYASLNKYLLWLFRPFLRESERMRPAGSTFMLLGVTLSVYIFPRPVVLLTILFFALADPLAGYVGTRFGRDRLVGPKTLQGTLAAFAACFVLTLIYCTSLHLMMNRLIIVAILSGLVGAVSELIPVANLDDNFIFPIVSSALMTVIFNLFGGLA